MTFYNVFILRFFFKFCIILFKISFKGLINNEEAFYCYCGYVCVYHDNGIRYPIIFTTSKKNQTIQRVDTTRLQLKLKMDLRVDVIHSSRCSNCDLPGIDAFYMSNILVDVSNHKVAGVGTLTESILTVTYFYLMQGQMVMVTKNLPKMHPYPTNPWTLQRYTVVNHPVLEKKSVGIKAEIKPKTTTVTDPVPANNIKIVKKCMVMVY